MQRPFQFQIVSALLAVALSTHAAGASQSPAHRFKPTLQNWLDFAKVHATGKLDESLAAVARWTPTQLEQLVWDLRSKLRTRGFPGLAAYGVHDSRSANSLIKQLTLLHTDAAMLNRAPHGYLLPATGEAMVTVEDGRAVGEASLTIHWNVARELLDAVQPHPRSEASVRQWYILAAAWLQHWREYAELWPHLVRARGLFSEDPVFAVYLGTMHEALAAPRIQNAIAVTSPLSGSGTLKQSGAGWGSSGTPSGPTRQLVDTAAGEWKQAEQLFREALRRDSAFSEARVRLARILLNTGRHEEAIRELESAAQSTSSKRLLYYAQLFLGDAFQATGRRVDAAHAFRAATDLYPAAQSPKLALSRMARAEGRLKDAVELLGVPATTTVTEVRDPWHEYHDWNDPGLDVLFEQFRATWRNQ